MAISLARPAPPGDDRRWKVVDARMRRLGYRPDALIEALHSAQDAFGFLDRDALTYIAGSLRVPPSRVYGVATFYSYFTLEPQGAHTCVVCMGTACYLNGATKLLTAIVDALGVKGPGDTTSDGRVSVLTAHCVGACSVAPVAVIDGNVHGNLSADAIVEQVGAL
jgi:bidirectional [NiFe] hydrogenase diaphorase subunit